MTETEIPTEEKTIPFYPDHISTEAKVAVGILVLTFIVGAIGLFLPVGLEAPADPMDTPAHTKPEWYFLFLYQMLKYVPKTLGVLIPLVALVAITIWPFLDNKDDTLRARRNRWILVIVALVLILGLTILGVVT